MNVLGMDVSHWQGNIDWQKAYAAGARAMYAKAGGCLHGNYFDGTAQQNLDGAQAAGFRFRGLYWFFDCDYSPDEQADYFIGLLKAHRNWNLLPCVDTEDQTTATQSQARYRIDRFCSLVERAFYLEWMRDYTRASWWDPVIGRVDWAAKRVDWLADYRGNSDPALPYGVTDWNVYQFSADHNGRGREFGCESADVDLDWFKPEILQPMPGLISRLTSHWLRKIKGNKPL